MNRAELLLHIARQEGLEFVFTSGNALCYPMHTHVSVYTITVVRSGIVRLIRRDSTNIYPAGSVYIVAPHEAHSPQYTDRFDIVSLCINKNHFSEMRQSCLVASCLKHACLLMERQLLHAHDVPELLAAIDTIYETTAAMGNPDIAPPKILQEWERWSAGHIPAEMEPPLSRFHFIHKFKKETGLTPHQYIAQNRMREAKKLLTSGSSIADAAVAAGFCDQSHLNRWFNRSIGVTPHAYRQSCFMLDS